MNARAEYLVNQLMNEALTAQEVEELSELAGSEDMHAAILQQLYQFTGEHKDQQDVLNRIASRIVEMDAPVQEKVRRVHFLRTAWFRYAAAILLVMGGVFYLWQSRPVGDQQVATIPQDTTSTDLMPGHDGAILTLADGSTIVLDSMGNGLVATQNNNKVVLKDGVLTYDSGTGDPAVVAYNLMRTPNGRQFQIQLPDGSKVWLNAASSIRYPTAFTGDTRTVEMTGEAYFEVAKDKTRPFRLIVDHRAGIEVLGTHFNVNAYDNERKMAATLLEGRVRVQPTPVFDAGQPAVILKPGQQAQLSPGKERIQVIDGADIDKVMAWKNGLFSFDGLSLEEVMRQCERWYDIEVAYEKGVPDIELTGKMTRDVTLSQLLEGLQMFNVHYRLEGRTLIILP